MNFINPLNLFKRGNKVDQNRASDFVGRRRDVNPNEEENEVVQERVNATKRTGANVMHGITVLTTFLKGYPGFLVSLVGEMVVNGLLYLKPDDRV